jgi:hypothetical protein
VIRPPGGRDPSHVLVLATLGAPQRRLIGGRRAHRADPEPDPTPVATARATVIEATPVPEAEAEAWLAELDDKAQDAELARAAAILNGAVHAQRLAAADPGVQDVALERALVARLGHGSGDQVAEGRWAAAIEVPVRGRGTRERRVAALRPQERIAALLGGRDEALACELLVLRARADLDASRSREAALQLRVALEAGIAELEEAGAPAPDMAERLSELRERRAAVGAAANAALQGPLDAEAAAAVEQTLSRLEAALRARSAAGFK